jgi:hypothetical protein
MEWVISYLTLKKLILKKLALNVNLNELTFMSTDLLQ